MWKIIMMLFILRKLRTGQDDVQQVRRKLIDHNIPIRITDIVSGVPFQQKSAPLGVCDSVVLHLLTDQVVVVDADVVQVNSTLAAADADLCQCDLRKLLFFQCSVYRN